MATPRPNVLLITCDALRGDHVGACTPGSHESFTPNLDRLAARGAAFQSAISQGCNTGVSMPSLFTGKTPSKLTPYKIPSPFRRKGSINGVLIGEQPSIAELLSRSGYRTGGINSNPLLTPDFGFDKGFDWFHNDFMLKKSNVPASLKRLSYRLPRLLRPTPHMSAAAMNHKALSWLRQTEPPFFLWMHYMDAHGPYQPKKGLRYVNKLRAELLYQKAMWDEGAITEEMGRTLHDWYREEIVYLDEHLGKLFASLEAMKRMDDTLIIITADHGDEFREHGRFGHHTTMYNELLHVPLIVKLPGERGRGKVETRPVALTQVVPTVLDCAGAANGEEFDGASLRGLIESGDDRCLPEWIVSEVRITPTYKACLQNAEWKFTFDAGNGNRKLFDLRGDPAERENVVGEKPDVAAALEAILVGQRSQAGTEKDFSAMDDVVVKRLEDLGYL